MDTTGTIERGMKMEILTDCTDDQLRAELDRRGGAKNFIDITTNEYHNLCSAVKQAYNQYEWELSSLGSVTRFSLKLSGSTCIRLTPDQVLDLARSASNRLGSRIDAIVYLRDHPAEEGE